MSMHVADGMSVGLRTELARAWLADAAMKHASVTSFSHLSSTLLVLGAPQDLVHRALTSATEEITQARCCIALSGSYAQVTAASVPSDVPAVQVHSADPLLALIERTVMDGCLREGFAARSSELSRESCEQPYVRETLALIAEDEARHEELAWAVLGWAISEAGPRGAAHAAKLAEILPLDVPLSPLAGEELLLLSHGRLPPLVQRQLYAEVREELADRLQRLGECAQLAA